MNSIIWTKERCAEEALKYNSRIEFKTKNRYAYNKACEYKCLDEICQYNTKYKTRNYWTKERCAEEALKYSKRGDFLIKSKGAYNAASKNGWLEEICSHIPQYVLPNNYWNKDRCAEEAKKYETKKDFVKNASGCYSAALNNGWLDDVCKHMKLLGNMYNRCIYAFEFEDNKVYIGLTYDIDKRHKEHLNKNKVVSNHIKTGAKYVLKQLTPYIDVLQASLLEEKFKNQYKEDGWDILNKNKCGCIGGYVLK
jgi:predicted GIY-YIG superfamily endonuclease